MEVFILACLTACLLFSLIMACVQLIKIEKGVIDLNAIVEERVKKIYEGEE
jgi:hypothetical protein